MADKTVWKKCAIGLALLAVARLAGFVHAADGRNLNGVWQCRFLKANNAFESSYYSHWTFDAAKKEVVIFWSPVHKGKQLAYDWDGKQLVLDSLSVPPRQNIAKYKAEMNERGELIIENSDIKWKGWLCQHRRSEQWPPDGLQFLDYSRYPWLSGLIEDDHEIMKYRDQEQYEEWRRGQPR